MAGLLCELWFVSKPLKQYTSAELQAIADQLHGWHLVPAGTEGYRTAEVTLGGVDTREVSSKTMESLKAPGLYFIGEVLDVTGHLGGFNFQWAWASGYAAGQASRALSDAYAGSENGTAEAHMGAPATTAPPPLPATAQLEQRADDLQRQPQIAHHHQHDPDQAHATAPAASGRSCGSSATRSSNTKQRPVVARAAHLLEVAEDATVQLQHVVHAVRAQPQRGPLAADAASAETDHGGVAQRIAVRRECVGQVGEVVDAAASARLRRCRTPNSSPVAGVQQHHAGDRIIVDGPGRASAAALAASTAGARATFQRRGIARGGRR